MGRGAFRRPPPVVAALPARGGFAAEPGLPEVGGEEPSDRLVGRELLAFDKTLDLLEDGLVVGAFEPVGVVETPCEVAANATPPHRTIILPNEPYKTLTPSLFFRKQDGQAVWLGQNRRGF